MPYWLTNPEHGVMPVYERAEVERNAQWGWVLLNEGERPEFKKNEQEPEKRKPGRPRKQ